MSEQVVSHNVSTKVVGIAFENQDGMNGNPYTKVPVSQADGRIKISSQSVAVNVSVLHKNPS